MSSPPRRKIGSRACDGCKIRKVRCSEAPPCTRCVSISIECTFNKRQATRGPRSLRAKTIAEIRNIQEREEGRRTQAQTSARAAGPDAEGGRVSSATTASNTAATAPATASTSGSPEGPRSSYGENPGRSGAGTGSGIGSGTGPGSERGRTPVSSLIVRLCLYNQRLFPVWPILSAEDVIGSLLRDPSDAETYALANAVCAAIIAQLKLPFEGRTDDGDPATAASMAAECQRAKTSLQERSGDRGNRDGPEPDRDLLNLNMLRISFFQHIYHENLRPGGSKSLLFLREAITTAQIIGLHRRSTYTSLPAEEQQMRRRTLWLLFVTERGVAMLHKLPTVLVWQPSFPALDGSPGAEPDEAHILPAFRKLVELFWVFDQGGAFDLIHADDYGDAQRSGRLEYLQCRLQGMSDEEHEINEVQRADILVTTTWMKTVLWRASIKRSRATMPHEQSSLVPQPYGIVNDFLSHISHYSKTALEAHGPTIELKIYEIASALTDALATNLDLLQSSVSMSARPVDMLIQLQRLLASSRGGNKPLLTLLCARIAEVENGMGSPEIPTSPPDPPLAEADCEDEHGGGGDGTFQTTGRVARRRSPYSAYPNYPLQLPAWPDPNHGSINVDPCGNLGIMFTQLTNESWNGWTVDLGGTSQIPL